MEAGEVIFPAADPCSNKNKTGKTKPRESTRTFAEAFHPHGVIHFPENIVSHGNLLSPFDKAVTSHDFPEKSRHIPITTSRTDRTITGSQPRGKPVP